MTIQPGANVYTQGFGSRPENVEVPHIDVRAPATTDTLYPVGKRWIDTSGGAEYSLINLSTSNGIVSANWALLGTDTGALNTLTGDSGGAISPSAGNINLVGTANQIATTGAGSTITFSLVGPYTPATYTAHGVLLGEGASSIVATAAGTNGQVLIGSTGADPAFATITSSGSTLTLTGGANTLNIDVTAPLNVAHGGTGLTTITAHDLLIGNGTSAITLLAPSATSGVALISQGAASNPAYGTVVVAGGGTGAVTLTGVLTGNGTSAVTANAVTNHGVLIGGASNAVSSLGVATSGQVLIGATGADPAFGALGVNSGLTVHGVLLGENNSAIAATTAGTNGQVLLGSTAADPAFGTITSSGGTITFTPGAASLNMETAAAFTAATAFTPAFSLATAGDSAWTYSSRVGRYTRMGPVVYFIAELVWSAFANTTGSGNWQLNLPVAAGAFAFTGHVHISGSGVDISAEATNFPVNFVGEIGTGASIVVLSAEEQGAVQATSGLFNLTVTQVKSTGTMNVSGWYFAA